MYADKLMAVLQKTGYEVLADLQAPVSTQLCVFLGSVGKICIFLLPSYIVMTLHALVQFTCTCIQTFLDLPQNEIIVTAWIGVCCLPDVITLALVLQQN